MLKQARRSAQHYERWARAAGNSAHPAHHERSLHSQNGEDGIIEAILDTIGLEGGVFWEFGAADGEENCTRALAERAGWSGVWVEGDPTRASAASDTGTPLGVTTHQAFVTRENAAAIVEEAPRPDVLVIDLDQPNAQPEVVYPILRTLLAGDRPE